MKHYGKLYAAAAAGFMALNALGAAPVLAEGAESNAPNTDWDVNINKTVTKDAGTAVPQEQFAFVKKVPENVAPENNIPMFADAELLSAITINNPTTPSTTIENAQDTSVQLTAGNISVNPAAFAGKATGIYRFEISETNGSYEDLTYSTASYYVDVFVTVSEESTAATGLRVSAANGSVNDNVKVGGMDFTNDYTKRTNSNLHNLNVTKKITGNQADMDAQFPFVATVTGAAGEQFYWETSDKEHPQSGVATSGDEIKCELGNDETLTVYGLSNTDTYTVRETNDDGSDITNNTTTAGYTVSTVDSEYTAGSDANASVTVTNHRNGTIPTGILMTAAPYAALVGLGAIFAGFFFRRKRED